MKIIKSQLQEGAKELKELQGKMLKMSAAINKSLNDMIRHLLSQLLDREPVPEDAKDIALAKLSLPLTENFSWLARYKVFYKETELGEIIVKRNFENAISCEFKPLHKKEKKDTSKEAIIKKLR